MPENPALPRVIDPATVTLAAANSPRHVVDRENFSRGDTIGRYVVLDAAGSGGMGVVYAAFDPELDRKVAIKLLRRGTSKAQGTAVARSPSAGPP